MTATTPTSYTYYNGPHTYAFKDGAAWIDAHHRPPTSADVLLWVPDAMQPHQIGYWEKELADWHVEGLGYLEQREQNLPTYWTHLPDGP